jgi:translation initiation factor IF-1
MKSGGQIMATKVEVKAVFHLLAAFTALSLTGCWTPPNANVQPPGEPRLIQSGVSAVDNDLRATVQGFDPSQRALNLKLPDGTEITCTVNPQVKNFDRIQFGDKVKVRLAEELAIYVLKDGRLPIAGGKIEAIGFNAKVQSVDPSYRLLKLQYLNGQTQELKAGLDAKLMEMQPGDAVVLQSAEALAVHIEKNETDSRF